MDKITIANMALQKIGAQRIASFDDALPEALAISTIYDPILDEVLCEHLWTFAQKRIALSTLTETPVFTDDGMTVMYSKPSDLIKINFYSDPSAFVKVEGDKILSDTSNLKIQYTYRNRDASTYYSKFVAALIGRLAYELCFNLSESAGKAEKLREEYSQILLPQAVSSDSQQGTPLQPDQSEWDAGRFIGGNAFVVQKGGQQTWNPVW